MLYSMLKEKLHELAPRENGFKDDIYGLQFGSILKDQNLHNIIISLECSKEVILEARKLKSHLIISHHGLISKPTIYFNDNICNEIKLLSMSNICLFVIHQPWHFAARGISDAYAKHAGINIEKTFYKTYNENYYPIGRIGVPFLENSTVDSMCNNLKRNLGLPSLQIAGNPKNKVTKVIVKGGTGIDTSHFLDIVSAGCNTIISGEFSYQEFVLANKLGLNLIATSHHASEKSGMENLQRILSLEFPRDNFIFVPTNDPVLII